MARLLTEAAHTRNAASPDFFGLADLLTDEERQVQQLVGRWVDERVLPIIGDAFDQHTFPRDLIPEMAEMGLFGPTLQDYGCAGLSNIAYGLIMQELERGDSGLRSFASVQSGLVMYPIHKYGSDEQKQQWLPDMAKARKIGCFGLTEPDGGSDPGAMKTHAKKQGGDWVINGAKMWITNGTVADVAVVWAMTDNGVRGFLVEKGTPGYSARDIHKKMSLRASITSELFFDNVRIPARNQLPKAEGLAGPLGCLTQARYGIAWGVLGAAQACYQEALTFAKSRILFGRPLTHTQTIQIRLADMLRRITTGQLLAWRLGKLKEDDAMHHTQVSLAKWNNCRLAIDIARDARDLLGGMGITTECCPIRHANNLESVITYEGTETIHQLVVGREITGIAAF